MKAQDGAKPDMDALKAGLDELGSKVETARVDVDDKAGSANDRRLAAAGLRGDGTPDVRG